MAEKSLPFDRDFIEEVSRQYPTPFHLYDERGIRENARRLKQAFFRVSKEYKNYFAVKALPNPHILSILKEEGMGIDCSSLTELLLAEATGFSGDEIMFSSNNTPIEEFAKAKELDAIINLDDIEHISFLENNVGMPERICMRFNPGPLVEGNDIIGKPTQAKYGFTRDQLLEGYKRTKDMGVKRFGLHTMVISNEREPEAFIMIADSMFDMTLEIYEKTGVRIEFLNLGGGIGIPYALKDKPVDLEYLADEIRQLYEHKIVGTDLDPLVITMECGRMVTGPFGYLVTRALHKKQTYKTYIGVDACMADLMRPAIYGAYHHITVLGKQDRPKTMVCDITGSLCENNDKFAIDRKVPEILPGDLLAIHDTGAHGYAMGFNYNGKLRSAELLLKQDGTIKQIRRAESIKDYFTTLDFPGL